MKTRIALVAVALGASLVVGSDAYAKGGKKGSDRPQTVNLTRPSGGSDYDAQGTVKVHTGKKGDQTVITLSHLRARTVYEIHDADTGDLLGTVKTDRRGKATFNLTKNVQKAASVGGSNGDVANVDVVDPASGDTVLTGDVTPPAPVPAEGYQDYSDDAGDSASVYLSTDPDYGDIVSVSFFPAIDPNADPATQKFSYYEFDADTSNGDALPLDVSTAAELAGRAFEIRSDADGSMVLSGNFPDLTAIDTTWQDDGGDWSDWGGDSGGNWGGDSGGSWGGDWSGDWGGDWTHDCTTSNDPGTTKGRTKSARKGGAKETASNGFTLFIADQNGDLQKAEALVEQSYDDGGDYGDYGDWGGDTGGGDWGSNWGNINVLVFVLPSDGSFDVNSFLDQLFSGNFDFSAFDPSAASNDPSGAGVDGATKSRHKHKHK